MCGGAVRITHPSQPLESKKGAQHLSPSWSRDTWLQNPRMPPAHDLIPTSEFGNIFSIKLSQHLDEAWRAKAGPEIQLAGEKENAAATFTNKSYRGITYSKRNNSSKASIDKEDRNAYQDGNGFRFKASRSGSSLSSSLSNTKPQEPPKWKPVVSCIKSTTGYDGVPSKEPPTVYGYVHPDAVYTYAEGYKPEHGWYYKDAKCSKDLRKWVEKCAMEKAKSSSAYKTKPDTKDVDKIYPEKKKDRGGNMLPASSIRNILDETVPLVKRMSKFA
eukprot:jgi/Bigna1/73426/fgenesh1_pg.24_\